MHVFSQVLTSCLLLGSALSVLADDSGAAAALHDTQADIASPHGHTRAAFSLASAEDGGLRRPGDSDASHQAIDQRRRLGMATGATVPVPTPEGGPAIGDSCDELLKQPGASRGSEESLTALEDDDASWNGPPADKDDVKRFSEFVGKRLSQKVDGKPGSMYEFLGKRTPYEFLGKRTPYEFLGKRTPYEFLGKRTPYEFLGKRTPYEFLGKRTPYEFLGKRTPYEFLGKRTPYEFLGKRTPYEFLGKRVPYEFLGKRAPYEFLGKRMPYEFLGKRSPYEFLGKRSPYEFLGKRAPYEFIGKRYEFVGKRSPYEFVGKRPELPVKKSVYDFFGKRVQLPYEFVGKRMIDNRSDDALEAEDENSDDFVDEPSWEQSTKRYSEWLGKREQLQGQSIPQLSSSSPISDLLHRHMQSNINGGSASRPETEADNDTLASDKRYAEFLG